MIVFAVKVVPNGGKNETCRKTAQPENFGSNANL